MEPDHGLELPPFDGGIVIPANRKQAYDLFGDPNHYCESVVERYYIVPCDLKDLWLHADPAQTVIKCHRLAVPYVREAMRRCQAAGVLDEIVRLESYRRRRVGGARNGPWSYHSLGVAVDINPEANPRKSHLRAIKPFSRRWRRNWPNGLSERLVTCWESVGWRWGGRFVHYRNPMHFQLVGGA